MDNLLVEVYVPSILQSFDILIPRKAKMFELLPLITTIISQLSDGLFVANDAVLCDGNSGAIYSSNMSVSGMQLKNGSLLMLV